MILNKYTYEKNSGRQRVLKGLKIQFLNLKLHTALTGKVY